jgi:Fe-S-cluster-containing dehydrogenase component
MPKGILVNYDYCTGCHSCEVACKKELGLPKGEFGIKVTEVGPFQFSEPEEVAGKWEWTYMPVITQACDLCKDRTDVGKMPMCVQHCQAWCMYYGDVEELVKKIDGESRWSLISVKQ